MSEERKGVRPADGHLRDQAKRDRDKVRAPVKEGGCLE